MNKKGFTLIELIAVITIMGIVSIMMVPSLQKVLSDNNTSACRYYKEAMVEAARSFISKESVDIIEANNNSFPSNYKLTAEYLISLDYLSEYTDSRTTVTDAYVLVNKGTNNTYTYTPNLTCKKLSGEVIELSN